MDLDKLIALRHELHQHPEIAGEETSTALRIKQFIDVFKPDDVVSNIGGDGIAFIFSGEATGPRVMFRAELDALPIEEVNIGLPYLSLNEGKGHKCGHDGHMVMVAGIAHNLANTRPHIGEVVLMFQPAEETGEGAERMLADNKFKNIKPDYIFALHNLPGYPKNQIILKKGIFASASKGLIFELTGSTSHAAEPENGNSPLIALSHLLQYLHHLPDHTSNLDGFGLSTVVHCRMGDKAFGTTPGYGVVMCTIRAHTNEDLQRLEETAIAEAKQVNSRYNLELTVTETEGFSATYNTDECVSFLNKAATSIEADIHWIDQPFRWSEDFGLFTQECKGAMFGLGAGEDTPDLHNADYDFPDTVISTGVAMYNEIIKQILYKKENE